MSPFTTSSRSHLATRHLVLHSMSHSVPDQLEHRLRGSLQDLPHEALPKPTGRTKEILTLRTATNRVVPVEVVP